MAATQRSNGQALTGGILGIIATVGGLFIGIVAYVVTVHVLTS